jgi:hypothetical protein
MSLGEEKTWKKNIYSERASPQPSHQDWMRWTEISAAMPPWWRGRICFAHSLANSPWIEIQKGAYNNLAALNQDWPKQMAHDMVYWYWLLIWIWCSYIYIDIVNIYIIYIYILYIYATNVEPIVLMLVLASSGICLYESNVIEIKCEIHKDITNQASLISLAWCWDGSGWNKIPLECRP